MFWSSVLDLNMSTIITGSCWSSICTVRVLLLLLSLFLLLRLLWKMCKRWRIWPWISAGKLYECRYIYTTVFTMLFNPYIMWLCFYFGSLTCQRVMTSFNHNPAVVVKGYTQVSHKHHPLSLSFNQALLQHLLTMAQSDVHFRFIFSLQFKFMKQSKVNLQCDIRCCCVWFIPNSSINSAILIPDMFLFFTFFIILPAVMQGLEIKLIELISYKTIVLCYLSCSNSSILLVGCCDISGHWMPVNCDS